MCIEISVCVEGQPPARPRGMQTRSGRRLILQRSENAARGPRSWWRAALAVVAVFFALAPVTHATESLGVGQSFPTLTEHALEGVLPDTSGSKVVVVDFWASWCTPCRAAFPVLDEIQGELGPKGLQIIAVSVDQNRAAMDTFLKKRPVGFAVLRDARASLVKAVNVSTMPTTFVLDGAGVVRFVHAGFHGDQTRDALRAQIQALLEEQS